MILVKTRAFDHLGRKCAEIRTMRVGDHFVTTVVLTEDFPGGPDVGSFNSWTASEARAFHIGGARAIAGRMVLRQERAAARPPCPHCGVFVERVGVSAKIPKFCSAKCGRAARFARWYAKHGTERNERRRAA